MTVLTERSERIRAARKLTRKPAREKTALFLAEGVQAVREAVATGPSGVVEVFVGESAQNTDVREVATAAGEVGIPVRAATDAAVGELSETITPQGIVAVCRSVCVSLDEALPASPSLVTVLCDVRDPGNAGTVVRCSDAAGADAVVFTHGSVDPQGGKAVRASAGSLFHLPIGVGATPEQALSRVRDAGLLIAAADGAGDCDLHEADALLNRPTAWVFGNEAWGLPAQIRDLADVVVRVPIYGRAESLNLATAAAVCLYASARAQNSGR